MCIYQDRLGWGHIRQTIQSPEELYKDRTDYTKPPKDYTKPLNIRQNLNILNKYFKLLDKYPKYSTSVATSINLPDNTKYPIFENTSY